jgi:type 1 fimbria pilin
MLKKGLFVIGIMTIGFLFSGQALAHTPLCSCYDNGDGTVTCEGGFSDGSSASGVQMRVEKSSGGILTKGKMDEDSEYTFDKPADGYRVVFDAGEGHIIEIDGKEIIE